MSKDNPKIGCAPAGVAYIIVFFLMLTIICSCSTTQYVPVEKIRDVYHETTKTDSINIHDSIYIKEKGDTVFFTKYHTEYRYINRTDSFIQRDTIPQPYPVEVIKKVEKELSWWQSIKMELGGLALGSLIIILIYFGIKIIQTVKSSGWKGLFNLILRK